MSGRIVLAALLLGSAPLHAQPLARPSGHLAGDFIWELKLANGLTSRWTTTQGRAGAVADGSSVWLRDGVPVGPARDVMVLVGAGHYLAKVDLAGDEASRAYAARTDTPELEAVRARHSAVMDKSIAECGTGADEKPGCAARYSGQIDKLGAQIVALEAVLEKKALAVSAVCTRLKLRLQGMAITGTADHCAGQDNVK
ncbi:MAG TPA: hypothetical protein VIT92_13905, partial [Burkholderiaceae bacterium]